jgi:hypothetical protein
MTIEKKVTFSREEVASIRDQALLEKAGILIGKPKENERFDVEDFYGKISVSIILSEKAEPVEVDEP